MLCVPTAHAHGGAGAGDEEEGLMAPWPSDRVTETPCMDVQVVHCSRHPAGGRVEL